MEAALVSAATGALRPVLGKLAALLGDKYKRFKGVRKEMKSLTDELTAMHNFLLRMSEVEDPDVQDKAWMAEVRELSYDMEDAIDEFMLCVDDKDAKPDGFMDKIKISLGKMRARHRIGSEIQDLKKQIIEVGERNTRYKTREVFANTRNTAVDPRALAIFEHASKLVGIDEPMNEIIKLLMHDDGRVRTQPLKIVSVVGSGGMGKTTLVNRVYQELKGQFECQAFLSVSRNPDLMNIMRTILSRVSNQDYASTEAGSIQQVIINITNFLAGKRYLIVVDDIWDVETWNVIKCAFPMTSCGSRIVTTSRMNNVAHSCCSSFSGYIYNIRSLNMMHSRQLFHRRLFTSVEDCPTHLKDVADQILEKCVGLPLAIIAISGLLANRESTKDQWDQVKNSIGHALERNPTVEGMMKILSLSYFDLPPHLETCLLYLSTFPEDHIIKKIDLINSWIAEGFIPKEGTHTVHESGEMCFNDLANRNLIQLGGTDKYGLVKICRVHDTILDFIISKSIEENFITLDGGSNLTTGKQSKVRRLSLQVGKQGNSVIPTSLVLSHVRSFNVFSDSREIPSLDQFRHLRVLNFRNCYQLGNYHLGNIGRLFQLRYLNLRNTAVSNLPEQIGHLRCLEMIDLRNTNVRELPEAIVNLRKLVHLLVETRVKFPDGIAKIQALEMLKEVNPFNQSLNFLVELGQLKNLRNLHLDLEKESTTGNTMGAKECKKAIASSLHKLGTHNLRSLTVVYGDNFLQEPWCPPLSLQSLMLYWSPFPQVPNWMSSLVNLQQLRLEVEGLRQDDLCILGALPSLLILDIIGVRKSRDRLRVSGEVGFRCLRMFFYYIQDEGMELMFAAGSMPKLEKLRINVDTDEIKLRTSDALNFGMDNLPCLITVECALRGRVRSALEAARDAMVRAAGTNPNHPSLIFV
ncbi:disease resistance protein RGA5 [Aegilops tauschii subsp. strangulata]|uniref:Disease resistance protein RPM1 n=3 Tax=Aegilops tauschii subsp. strangulata TaxID=200361 RepID=A0A453DYR9_AEGTS|nr:disease resistance protein PIK6-NP [Aegilops tauschii subsp. strangulata]